MKIGELGEFTLISHLTQGLAGKAETVACPVGDDAAAVRVSRGKLLLATCDVQIEGVHFTRGTISAEQIGRRVAAVNISDIAAMGGKPTFALASLAAPASTDLALLQGIYKGLEIGLGQWGAVLVGGNTAELPERLVIDLMLLGEVSPGQMLCRGGAKPGDVVCVTGQLGSSAAGLRLLEDPGLVCVESDRLRAVEQHLVPVPRLEEGLFLGAQASVTACIDLSDGLLGDAGHIAEMSGVTVSLSSERVPVAPEARAVARAADSDPLELALSGGEDYELLFTVAPDSAKEVLQGLERQTGTVAAVIGEIRTGPARAVVLRDGEPMVGAEGGFEHFAGKTK